MSSTCIRRAVMNHFFFQLLYCNRAQFLNCGCPCCFGDAPDEAFVPRFWEISTLLRVPQNFQHANGKEFVEFLINVQGKSINAWRGPWDLPLEGLLNQFQGQWLKERRSRPLQRCRDWEGLHVLRTLFKGSAPFPGDATPVVT